MDKFDLHTHTRKSDGSDSPAELVNKAKAAGLSMVAITDHDTVLGVSEAVAEGERIGIWTLPGIEFDTEFDGELHILGLGLNADAPEVSAAMKATIVRREERNRRILNRLREAGIDAEPYMDYGEGTVTRLHVARAIVKAGAAKTVGEAFDRFLRRGCIANVPSRRPTQEATIALIHGAGGIAVLAHPCKLKCDVHKLIGELCEVGLDGVEAFYPTSTEGQTALNLSIAAQHGLYVSCGCDYHGAFRDTALGSAWREDERLDALYRALVERYRK